MSIRPNEIIIDDSTNNDLLFRFQVDGEVAGRGAVERDYHITPTGMFSPPSDMTVYSESEIKDRAKEAQEQESAISHILLRGNKGQAIPSTNQKSSNYCWAYSTSGCVIALRALNNQPYVVLSPHSVAVPIKGGANQGGWCGLSAQFIEEHGVASEEFWPLNSFSTRNDTPEARANMRLHRVTESWIDLDSSIYGRKLTRDQIATCLVNNIPVAADFSWWSHSVMLTDVVVVDGEIAWRFRNSWGDGYGDQGFSLIRGGKMNPMGAVALRVTGATGS